MHKNRLIILLVLGLTFIPFKRAYSQTISKTFGEYFDAENKFDHRKIFRINKSYYSLYTNQRKTDEILIKKFSSNLNLEDERVFNLDVRKQKNELTNVFCIKDQIWLFYKSYTRNSNSIHLHLLTLDPENFTVSKDQILLSFEENDAVKIKKINFNIFFNTDSTIFAAMADKPNKADKEKYEILLFDKNQTPLNSIEVDSDANDENLELLDLNINRIGTVFIQKFKNSTNEYILKTYIKGKQVTNYKISAAEHYIRDLRFISSNDSVMIYSGLGINGAWSCNASYYLKYNYLKKQVVTENKDTLSRSFINQHLLQLDFLDTPPRKVKNAGIDYANVKEVVPRSDGGAVLICEQETVKSVNNTYFDAYGVLRSYNFWYYVNAHIFILNINPDGKIDWSKQLPKKQITTNDNGYYNSFKYVLTPDKLYFIYNGNNLNGDDYIPEKTVYQNMELKKMNYVTNAYTITIDGKIAKQQFFNYAEIGTFISPKNIFQVSRTEAVILARHGKSDRLILLKLGE